MKKKLIDSARLEAVGSCLVFLCGCPWWDKAHPSPLPRMCFSFIPHKQGPAIPREVHTGALSATLPPMKVFWFTERKEKSTLGQEKTVSQGRCFFENFKISFSLSFYVRTKEWQDKEEQTYGQYPYLESIHHRFSLYLSL